MVCVIVAAKLDGQWLRFRPAISAMAVSTSPRLPFKRGPSAYVTTKSSSVKPVEYLTTVTFSDAKYNVSVNLSIYIKPRLFALARPLWSRLLASDREYHYTKP
jgi:hypothetical protein